jgi:hypothetical protein
MANKLNGFLLVLLLVRSIQINYIKCNQMKLSLKLEVLVHSSVIIDTFDLQVRLQQSKAKIKRPCLKKVKVKRIGGVAQVPHFMTLW